MMLANSEKALSSAIPTVDPVARSSGAGWRISRVQETGLLAPRMPTATVRSQLRILDVDGARSSGLWMWLLKNRFVLEVEARRGSSRRSKLCWHSFCQIASCSEFVPWRFKG